VTQLNDELDVTGAFERLLDTIVDTLNAAHVPAQPERIGEIVVGVLYSKLSCATRAADIGRLAAPMARMRLLA
jgi:hypothetical protein